MSFNTYNKICKYAADCPVFNETLSVMISPNLVIKNVFCKRGEKGWYNCKRFCGLEKGFEISKMATPYNE